MCVVSCYKHPDFNTKIMYFLSYFGGDYFFFVIKFFLAIVAYFFTNSVIIAR